MHDLLRVADLAREEFVELLELAQQMKTTPGAWLETAPGKAAAVLFEKPSLRTRFSVEVALVRLGAHPIGAYDREVGLGTREPIADVAHVLDGYVDLIVIRTFAQQRVTDLADAANVPVVNALSDEHHPLQGLADLLTLAEERAGGDVRGLKDLSLAYLGDGNNVAHSLIEACALTGTAFRLACAPGKEPDEDIVAWARAQGADVTITGDPLAAADGADAVYTDVWTSMGQESEEDERKRTLAPFRVTSEVMAAAAPGAIFLHCLPAHRGDEVDADVIDGPASRVFPQAENRLHTAQAVFARQLGMS